MEPRTLHGSPLMARAMRAGSAPALTPTPHQHTFVCLFVSSQKLTCLNIGLPVGSRADGGWGLFSLEEEEGSGLDVAVVYPDCNRSRHAFNGLLRRRRLQKAPHTPLCVVFCSGEHSGVTKCFIISPWPRLPDPGQGLRRRRGVSQREGVSTDDYTWVGI